MGDKVEDMNDKFEFEILTTAKLLIIVVNSVSRIVAP